MKRSWDGRGTAALRLIFAVMMLAWISGGTAAWAQSSNQPQARASVDLLDPDFWKTATPEQVRQAVRGGADVNARDKDGVTPLHRAAALNGNPEVIYTLIQLGADVNARDKNGWTPLHWAARFSKKPEVVLVLLKLGADPKARTDSGITAWDLIQENEALRNTPAYWKLNDLRW